MLGDVTRERLGVPCDPGIRHGQRGAGVNEGARGRSVRVVSRSLTQPLEPSRRDHARLHEKHTVGGCQLVECTVHRLSRSRDAQHRRVRVGVLAD
jgi:hypothetical protein